MNYSIFVFTSFPFRRPRLAKKGRCYWRCLCVTVNHVNMYFFPEMTPCFFFFSLSARHFVLIILNEENNKNEEEDV